MIRGCFRALGLACWLGSSVALDLAAARVAGAAEPVAASEPTDGTEHAAGAIRRPSESLGLDPFYQKHLDAGGIPVVGSAAVSDYALREAAYLVDRMLEGRPALRKALADNGVRVVVMAVTEMTTDVPEHRHLTPKTYWDRRARGLGATRHAPVVSCGEENLLGLRGDPYATENIFVHEFAHTIDAMALRTIDEPFASRLRAAYHPAREKGLWKNTYAGTNPEEYWAEGVQSWFDTNRAADREHNGVDTREKLKQYDPALAGLIAEALGETPWRYVPPRRRAEAAHLAGFDRDSAPAFAWPQRAGPSDAAGPSRRDEPASPGASEGRDAQPRDPE